jgi:hypothetical protein
MRKNELTREEVLQKHFKLEFGQEGSGQYHKYILDAMNEYASQTNKDQDLINKVRYYKKMYVLQKVFCKKVIGFLMFTSKNGNEFISNKSKELVNEFFTEFRKIKEIKHNNHE